MAGIRSNRHYNDPAIGAAFSSLAQAFGPPDSGDIANYATAAATREKAARLAELFAYAKDPNYSQTQADRLGVLGGLYAPNQSYYSVDQGNATTQRGQDITARTSILNNEADNVVRRYGIDTQAQTALETNRADNTRSAITSMFQPLNPGQVRPELPENVAGLVGLPALASVAGAPKPLSRTELEAAILGEQPKDVQAAAVLSSAPVENIATPEGPRTVYRSQAVGQEPFFNKGAEAKPTNAVAVTRDGTRIPAVQGPDGRWKHAQTGAELPADIQIMDLPRLQGSANDVGGATVANQTQANNQEAEVTRALNLLDIYENTVTNNPGAVGLAGVIRGTAQNAAATVQDLANSFGKQIPQVQEAAAEIRQGLQGVAPEFFDTSIPEAEFLQGTLAYALARTENPSGEVSRQAFDRALDRVRGGGLLANSQSAKAAIGANRRVLQTQLEGIRNLRNPGTGRTDTGFRPPPGVPSSPVDDLVNKYRSK